MEGGIPLPEQVEPMDKRIVAGLALLLATGTAGAVHPRLAAEQPGINASSTLALGGASSQQLAQTFTLSTTGYLSHVMVPVTCQPTAGVRVTIEKVDKSGAPNGSVLAYEELPGTLFTSVPLPVVGMRMVEFTHPPLLGTGTYAVVLRIKGKGSCGVYAGPDGDTYAVGKAWYIAAPNPPVWVELGGSGGTGVRDLAFQVYVRPL